MSAIHFFGGVIEGPSKSFLVYHIGMLHRIDLKLT